jgi:aspartyl-tRNA synthetase
MEMSFVEANDVMAMIDGLVQRLASVILGLDVALPLPRMTYDEAMERYGHDAPDLRYGMELVDCTALATDCQFRAFRSVVEAGGRVRGLNAKEAADKYSRRQLEELNEYVVQDFNAKGLAWFKVTADGELTSPIAKNFAPAILKQMADRLGAEPGDLLLFVADAWETTCKALAGLRKRLANELRLYNPQQMHFSWVVEFPMFERDEETGHWVAKHHPFTAPRPQDLAKLESDPGTVRAVAYDLIINGSEAGGGTIRIHDQAVQQQVFRLLGLDPASAQARFGFLLDALKYGAPPHGGIALGVDRFVMTFGGRDNIRDCIAFPKTQRAADLMTGAPSDVAPQQLAELGILVAPTETKEPPSSGERTE